MDRRTGARRLGAAGVCLLFLLCLPGAASAQGAANASAGAVRYPIDVDKAPRPVARAVRTQDRIVIDGRLDEAAWAEAPAIDNFIQSQPAAGMPATEKTVVRVLYDDDNLYVGAVLEDSDTRHLVVKSLERDFPGQSTRDADIFSFTLDTFLDRRNSFIYLINPYGAYRDGQTFDDSRTTDFGWDGVLTVRTRIYEGGWDIEIAIPWSSLRFRPDAGEQSWGVNFLRRVRRKNEDSYWAPVERRDPVHRMSRAGTLVGLEGLAQGGNVRVKPYALVQNAGGSALPESERETKVDGGFDVKLGLTPGLTLDGTFRTDFSQVEVDQERVNLTRFPLFFPEQRSFFVENSGSFTFGDVTEREYRMGTSLSDFTLFHSRRIGLQSGRPVPIIGGARLTGHAGPLEIGALDIQTESTEFTPAENFAVARVRTEVADGSDIGVMFINRAATTGDTRANNQSYGLDANFKLLGGLVINSYLARTQTPGASGDQAAGRLAVSWRDLHWGGSAMVRQIGDAFNPGAGFIRRTDIRQSYITLGTFRRPAMPVIFEVAPYIEYDYVTDLDERLLTRTATAAVDVDFDNGGVFNIGYSRRFEQLDQPFEIHPDVFIPGGGYGWGEASASYQSDAGRPLSGKVTAAAGDFYLGDRKSIAFDVLWQANQHLALAATADYNAVDVSNPTTPDGSFDSNAYGARLKYGFSTRVFASAYVQYNDARQYVSNFKFNFIHAPLSDFFIVYTERRESDGGAPIERLLTAKVTRLVTF